MPIFFKNYNIGTRRVDFLVDDLISVELKATIKLEDVHYAQAINYLEAYNLEIGLLKTLEKKVLISNVLRIKNSSIIFDSKYLSFLIRFS